MAAVHKKHEEAKEPSFAKASAGKEEPVVVSDVITETTERIEVIEEVTPQPAADPLTDFKEKMIEEEESPISDLPAKKNFMWPILFIVFLALALLGGIFVFKNTKTQKINVVTLSPTPTLSPAPTKTVDLTKYEIKILNGSGIRGEAGREKTSLEKEGFVITSIGNAANSDYTDTIIQAKKEVDADFLDKLKSVLEKSFTLAEAERLSETAVTPVVIIIGSKQ